MDTPVTERRFREGKGKKYLADGVSIRCHACSKTKLRALREKYNDYESPAESFFPEAQCPKPAVSGTFACTFHGGLTPTLKPKTLLDVLPVDLADKMRALQEHPDYISRKEDIQLLQARKWQLMESLQTEAGGEEAWKTVYEALGELQSGDSIAAEELIRLALESKATQEGVWSEVYKIEEVLKDLTNTQVKTAKELRLTATTEQITYLISGILSAITDAVNRYIDEPTVQFSILQYVSARITRLSNFGASAVGIPTLASGGEDGGNT